MLGVSPLFGAEDWRLGGGSSLWGVRVTCMISYGVWPLSMALSVYFDINDQPKP